MVTFIKWSVTDRLSYYNDNVPVLASFSSLNNSGYFFFAHVEEIFYLMRV